MQEILLGVIILSTTLYLILAIYFQNKLVKYILKLGTMLFILVLAVYGSGLNSMYSYFIVLAL
ncbi:hypothetical protein KGF86_14595 [Ornithinibacillus massiliensis]|uniref:Uncharacterized protein n=1 Tax=Ornithinibacillus massiliensis TaxID=1944633 RepID=A0ABS5MH42_9BACI|nr:hypothetical protein [Ornithinibacillus massiliensis]MBS3681427.1 hypothetical protein [Ornithinibacillus massiliensis]